MTWWQILLSILGGFLALLFLLLICPVRVRLRYDKGDISGRLTFLFFFFNLSPDALADKLGKKKKEKVPKEEPPLAEPEKPPEKEAKKGPGLLELVLDLLRSSQGARGILKRHVVLDRVEIYGAVCGEDAHKTALAYASVSGGVFSALTVIGLLCTLKDPTVFLVPDFTGTQSRYTASLRLTVRPLFALAAAINLLFQFLKLQINKKPRKGGTKYEPAASRQ